MRNRLERKLLMQRVHPRNEDVRGAFFRDTTAIIHSYPFRRLKHKTQVFFAPKNDHICTRIEHVMHVASIASAICKGLDLDEELAWAIGIGHDLGHAPFGHVGEGILDDLMSQHTGKKFIHERYSLRIVDYLAEYGKGLNLTYAVRDGIAAHCGEMFEQYIQPDQQLKDLADESSSHPVPSTWEGAVVRAADKIAYLGRDYEDALKMKLIPPGTLPTEITSVIGTSNREIISTLVRDVIDSSGEEQGIGFSRQAFDALCRMKEFNYHHIYRSPLLSDYHGYFSRVMHLIFDYLSELMGRFGFDAAAYRNERNLLAVRFGDYLQKMRSCYEAKGEEGTTIVCDYLAGMSDKYALDSVNEILQPRYMEEQFSRFLMEV